MLSVAATEKNLDSTSSLFDVVGYELPLRVRSHKKRYERGTLTGGSHSDSVWEHTFDLAALRVFIAYASPPARG